MVKDLFVEQTDTVLNIGGKLVEGRRYAIGVAGAATAFSLQTNMPGVGLSDLQGYTGLTPTNASTTYLVELPLLQPSLFIAFASSPATPYTVMIQELKEQH